MASAAAREFVREHMESLQRAGVPERIARKKAWALARIRGYEVED